MTFDAPGDFTVFISYAHADNESDDPGRRWLNRLLEQLQPLVLQDRVRLFSDTEIEIGERWDDSIKAEVERARAAVLLVSPAFLASEYIRNSELPALLMNAEKKGCVVLPVVLRPCLFAETEFKYPDPARGPDRLSLSVFQSANPPDEPLNALEEHEQDAVLLSVARRILRLAGVKPAAAPAPAGGGPVWHVPLPRNPFFTGRERVLEEIGLALGEEGKAGLSGMGGVGKTQAAAEYAYRRREEYRAVLWARADTAESLKADLAAMAARLRLPEKDETDRDQVVAAVERWLEEESGWLLILDNADDLRPAADLLRRQWGGHILLTTRAHATGAVPKIEVAEMSPEEGTLFLLRRAKLVEADDPLGAAAGADRALAEEITREVGGLPLALEQAGAFIEEGPSSLAEYLELYRSEGAQLRAARFGEAAGQESVTITFSLAFRQVEAASAAAADMLRACAFLAPSPIPEEVFVKGAHALGESLAPLAGGGITFVRVVGEAARFSLIRRNTKRGTIEIHRLVQQVLRDEMGAEARRLWAERAVRALGASFPQFEQRDWPLCEKLMPHAQQAARLVAEHGLEFAEASRLFNQAGSYSIERAQYAEAERLLARALGIYEKTLGPEHAHVGTVLNNMAFCHYRRGQYAKAESLYVRSLKVIEKAGGPDHPMVATCLNNLALLYQGQGRYAEAEPLFTRSLDIRLRVLPPRHPDTASSLNNLATFYLARGRGGEAEPLLVQALGIYEEVHGPEHVHVAAVLTNLALLYVKQDKVAEAEPLLARALAIRETQLGPEHPDVAESLNNLGFIYQSRGRNAEAEPLFVRALGIYEKALGPEHPGISSSLNNLGTLYDSQGRHAEAEPLYLRAQHIAEKALGPEHLMVALALNNRATHYREQGKWAEAEPLYLRALAICEKVLDEGHPDLAKVRENYADILGKMGRTAGG